MTTLDSGDTVTLLPEPILSPAEQQAATEAEAEAEAGLARRQLERAVDAGIAYRRGSGRLPHPPLLRTSSTSPDGTV